MPQTITQTCQVEGMHCAACARNIERTLGKIPGVAQVMVNLATSSATITFENSQTGLEQLSDILQPHGYTLKATQAPAAQAEQRVDHLRRHVWLSLPLMMFSLLVMSWHLLAQLHLIPMPGHDLLLILKCLLALAATVMLAGIGRPYLLGLWRFIRTGHASMDTLIGLGTLTAYIFSLAQFSLYGRHAPDYFDVTIIVVGFVTIGRFLEARARLKTGNALAQLTQLGTAQASVERHGEVITIPVESVQADDLIVLRPGNRLPVDGIVVDGQSYIDESMLTGEPIPASRSAGDVVRAGTLNTTGSLRYRATAIGRDTMLASIIRLVEKAQSSKAPIETLADRISAVFVPVVLMIATIAALLWLWFGTPEQALLAFVDVLVISCPCALGLATPAAMTVAMGLGARHGILIKTASAVQMLARVDTIMLDKTGTLTQGKPVLDRIDLLDRAFDETSALALLAALEKSSEHPLAHALLANAAQRQISLPDVTDFVAHPGYGLEGRISGKLYRAGSLRWMEKLGLGLKGPPPVFSGTAVALANDTQILALAWITDPLKDNATEHIGALQSMKLNLTMLTGDAAAPAQKIAQVTGITDVHAGLLPAEKLGIIQSCQQQGHCVAMVGDGLNDAPALAAAHVGISLSTSTGAAIEAADITLLEGDLGRLVSALRLARGTMRIVRQNLFWAFAFNLIGIPLAAGVLIPLTGWTLSPAFAALAMSCSSVLVVTNALRLARVRIFS